MTREGAQVLVVEDDPNLRLTLVDNLEEEGYRVFAAATAAEARRAFAERAHDVVVLDIMLPDGDGYALCRELRKASAPARVLMLTARTLEDDVVRGLDEGADDYVAKPYRLKELLARIRALARRAPAVAAAAGTAAHETLRFDRYRLEVSSRQLFDDAAGRPIELTRTEFDLLAFLVRNSGRALTRDEILDAVWGEDVVVDAHTVDNFVSNHRRKLGWSADGKPTIRAVRGVGYRMDLSEERCAHHRQRVPAE